MLPEVLIGCSSKSYFSLPMARHWAERVASGVRERDIPSDAVYVCPAFPLVPIFTTILDGTGVAVGTQDVSVFPPGAYTGEVSASLLVELGVRYVMSGHPERRRLCGEGPEQVNRKVLATVAAGMAPILIVGEPERMADPIPVIQDQFTAHLAGFPPNADLVVAYEPSWAIGQSEPAPADHIVATTATVRRLAAAVTPSVRVLYGGSATVGTFRTIGDAASRLPAGMPDGIFLGRGGLDPDAFLQTVDEVFSVGAGAPVGE
jgi:triosephosphate isomerase (TIM)